eukprot:403365996
MDIQKRLYHDINSYLVQTGLENITEKFLEEDVDQLIIQNETIETVTKPQDTKYDLNFDFNNETTLTLKPIVGTSGNYTQVLNIRKSLEVTKQEQKNTTQKLQNESDDDNYYEPTEKPLSSAMPMKNTTYKTSVSKYATDATSSFDLNQTIGIQIAQSSTNIIQIDNYEQIFTFGNKSCPFYVISQKKLVLGELITKYESNYKNNNELMIERAVAQQRVQVQIQDTERFNLVDQGQVMKYLQQYSEKYSNVIGVNELARGGEAVVYRIEHKNLEEVVAKCSLINPDQNSSQVHESLMDIISESQQLKLLSNPNFIAQVKEEIINFDEQNNQVLSYVAIVERAQHSLHDLFQIWNDPTKAKDYQEYYHPDKLTYYFFQVLQIMEFLNQRDLFCGDMKPQNLLVFRDQLVKVGDFGISIKAQPNVPRDKRFYKLKGVTTSYYFQENSSFAIEVGKQMKREGKNQALANVYKLSQFKLCIDNHLLVLYDEYLRMQGRSSDLPKHRKEIDELIYVVNEDLYAKKPRLTSLSLPEEIKHLTSNMDWKPIVVNIAQALDFETNANGKSFINNEKFLEMYSQFFQLDADNLDQLRIKIMNQTEKVDKFKQFTIKLRELIQPISDTYDVGLLIHLRNELSQIITNRFMENDKIFELYAKVVQPATKMIQDYNYKTYNQRSEDISKIPSIIDDLVLNPICTVQEAIIAIKSLKNEKFSVDQIYLVAEEMIDTKKNFFGDGHPKILELYGEAAKSIQMIAEEELTQELKQKCLQIVLTQDGRNTSNMKKLFKNIYYIRFYIQYQIMDSR